MAVCWVILRGQQIYTVIQAVHSLLYIVAKCHFFNVVVTWKYVIRYLQKCEVCTLFCDILCVCIYIYIYIIVNTKLLGIKCDLPMRFTFKGMPLKKTRQECTWFQCLYSRSGLIFLCAEWSATAGGRDLPELLCGEQGNPGGEGTL